MGKYLRKGKAAGKIAVMEVSQGALGVRTRAKTLALVEQDRMLALARSGGSMHQPSSASDTFPTSSYLELRSRKLEKVLKDAEKSFRSQPARDGGLNEDRNNSCHTGITRADEVACGTSPEGEGLPVHAEAVGSSRNPELFSPRYVDGFRMFTDYPIESAVCTQRASLDAAQLRCSESGAGEEVVRTDNVPPERSSEESLAHTALQGEVSVLHDSVSHGGINCGRSEAETSCEYAAGEVGIPPVRRSCFRGSPVSFSTREKEVGSDIAPGASTGTGSAVDRRMANHHHIMNRRYMRTNIFSDAKAVDELFAPDTTEREEGKRFTERYNYDVVHDKPLKGRYEWEPALESCTTIAPTTEEHVSDQQQPIRS